jgi:hypothetical protein
MSLLGRKDTFKHPMGSFERLTASNYASWKNSVRRVLRAISAWEIVTGLEQLPPLAPANSPANIAAAAWRVRSEFEGWRERAAALLHNACGITVRVFVDEMNDPHEMWLTLAERPDTASTAVGRQALYRKFMSLKAVPGMPIADFFAQLLEIRNQIIGTPEAISDIAFKTHVFASLPPVF